MKGLVFRTTVFSLVMTLAVAGVVAGAERFDELVAEGDRFDEALKSGEALRVYLEAEALRPNDARLLIKVAKQYGESTVDIQDADTKREQSEKALKYALRAQAQAPGLADAHLAVAICYGRLLNQVPARTRVEYSREVKRHTERAISLDSKSDYAWHMLGRWHQGAANLGMLTKGIVKLVYGGLPSASLEESAACFEKAVALKPTRVSHHIELGRTYAEMGRGAEARTAIEKGLALPNQEKDDPNTKKRGQETLGELAKSGK